MLLNIKSKYIISGIFENVNFKKVLKIIIYNKRIKNRLDITSDAYALVSGKYIEINGINGIGREYTKDENILIFEGHYDNFVRNGKGKELYKNGKIQFEGEYINGKRWQGKTYNYMGIEEFEIKEGSGNIREYNYNGIKLYEGDIVKGIKEGYGKEFFQGKVEYEGIFMNGKREVEGVEYYSNGNIEYSGGFKNGERNGDGKLYDLNENLVYEGEFNCGNWNGKGKEYNNGKLIFKGIYKIGKRWDGEGYDNFGNLLYRLIEGCGYVKEYNEDGDLIFEGNYKNGVKYGKGKEYIDGLKILYEGTYYNGKRSKGKGKEFNLSGGLKYEGEYLEGLWHGRGKEYENNGELSFEGQFFKGKRWNGYGKEFYKLGKIEYEGEYINGKRKKGIEYDLNGNIIFKGVINDDTNKINI